MTLLSPLRALALTMFILAGLAAGGSSAAGRSAALTGAWVGTYTLVGPGTVAFDLGGRAVALGVGHAGVQTVRASASGARVSFQLPGRPAPLVFTGSLKAETIRGTVRQGAVRGSFSE